MKPWRVVERTTTPAGGVLELRQRAEHDFLITIDGRVLMTSAARRSEEALAHRVCPQLPGPSPRVLVAGLGMGYTLAAALADLPADARVVVAERSPEFVAWGRGPLAALAGQALADPRVSVHVGDVADLNAGARAGGWQAILLDLDARPSGAVDGPCFGPAGLKRARKALASAGILAIWGEDHDAAFARAFARAGFAVEVVRVPGGGRTHVLYLGRAIRPTP
jgi:spermidine synthase